MLLSESVSIVNREIKKAFTYEKTEVLTLSIRYPEIESLSRSSTTISRSYRRAAQNYYNHISAKLYPSAVQEWKDSKKIGFPFRPYDAVMDYQITMNEVCRFCTYTDQYEYTGGAHGNTLRTSVNWDTRKGTRIRLKSLFPKGSHIREKITGLIAQQAQDQQAQEPVYFDNYQVLIAKYFNPESFYLTPGGIAFYYQQYEIGPYAIGIPTFLLTYPDLGIEPPECRNLT